MTVKDVFNDWCELTDSEKIEFWDMIINHKYNIPIKVAPEFQEYDINCTLCDLKLDKVMGYVCSRSNCPCGLGPLISSTC
jgi:hypothetical protein